MAAMARTFLFPPNSNPEIAAPSIGFARCRSAACSSFSLPASATLFVADHCCSERNQPTPHPTTTMAAINLLDATARAAAVDAAAIAGAAEQMAASDADDGVSAGDANNNDPPSNANAADDGVAGADDEEGQPPVPPADDGVAGADDDDEEQQPPVPPADDDTGGDDDDAAATKTDDGTEEKEGEEEEEEEEEKWDLNAIFSPSQIRNAEYKCAENCGKVACSVWTKRGAEDEEPWYACADCQFSFFEGFPTAASGDLPITSIYQSHRALIAERCTDGCTADMILPDLPTKPEPPAPPAASSAAAAAAAGGGAVTPPPGKGLVTTAKSKKGGKSSSNGKSSSAKTTATSGVTPSPVPPRGASAAAASGSGNISKKAAAKAAKAKAAALEPTLKKWQDNATSMGGGKIVVAKAEAKKIIFDMLSDAFRPMNITELFNELKGVVPSSVLKGCLEDMADEDKTNPFDEEDSDDEDSSSSKGKKKASKKKSADDGTDYTGSLVKKDGRNANNVLYFINYASSYVQNGGNGLPPDERNELIAAEQKSNQDLQMIQNNLKSIQARTRQLLSEPTNEEAEERQNREEKILADLQASVEESRQYAGNEKKREQTKKRIRNLADIWWKRRRQCTDFLQGMEDATEGTVSVKKCLAGDGQIDIDSDEAIINAEKEMHEMRKAKKAKKTHSASGGVPPSTNFIGVQFSSTSKVERVYV